MANAQEEAEVTTAREHGVSEDAVEAVLEALRRGGDALQTAT